MEESCFCQTDKYAYPSLCDRLCCCLCYKEKEELIKLNCCGKIVHRSCFINSSIIRSNNIINSKDTPETTTFSEIQICHYCQKPYDKKQFPNIPHTNEEVKLINKNRKLKNIFIVFWIIVLFLSFGNGLTDNVLLGSYKNKGIELYKIKYIENCKLNLTNNCYQSNNINKCCDKSFYQENWWAPVFVIITSVMSLFLFGIICSESAKDFRKKYFKIRFVKLYFVYVHGVYYKYQYEEKFNKAKNIYKSNILKFIIPTCMLGWQLLYLMNIIGYNQWYIPSHTSSNTTLEEAHKLALNYIPILCLFNIFWVMLIVLILFIICFLFYCCFDCYLEERNKVKNNILGGENNIKIYDVDINESLKKSNINYI